MLNYPSSQGPIVQGYTCHYHSVRLGLLCWPHIVQVQLVHLVHSDFRVTEAILHLRNHRFIFWITHSAVSNVLFPLPEASRAGLNKALMMQSFTCEFLITDDSHFFTVLSHWCCLTFTTLLLSCQRIVLQFCSVWSPLLYTSLHCTPLHRAAFLSVNPLVCLKLSLLWILAYSSYWSQPPGTTSLPGRNLNLPYYITNAEHTLLKLNSLTFQSHI